jgi:hypothetical protein
LYVLITVSAMSKKIDDLFAPERLRKNWQQAKASTGRPADTETEGETPITICGRLRTLIEERFSGDHAMVLNLLLDELQTLLASMFPTAGERPEPAEDPAEMIPAAHEILYRIEDLVEVFGMAGRSR